MRTRYPCAWLLGQPQQLEPLYERLRQIGITDLTTAETAVEKITGVPAAAKQWSYRERRKELLLALLDEHADSLDSAVEELGRMVDHLRQVGIRGFIAEHTGDEDFTYSNGTTPTADADEARPDDTSEDRKSGGTG
jgi:hypothetical protein